MENVPQKKLNKSFLLYAILFIGYLVFGFSENIKGPAIPRMQDDFGVGEMEVGLLLALNSAGYLLACSFTGLLVRKWGLKMAHLLAFGSMAAAGVLILLSFNFLQFTASYFLMYIGNGMLEIALGILAARFFTENTGRMMNLSHFFFGLSSTASPLLATWLINLKTGDTLLGWRGMYCLMLGLSVIPMLPAFFTRFPGESEEKEERLSASGFLREPAAWLCTGILSLGVVSELAVGGWMPNFLEKVYGWSPDSSAGLLSAFFLLYTLARLLLGPLTDKIGFVKSIAILSGFSGVCTLAGVLTGEAGAFLLALSGIGIAPIYPTVMAFLAKRYGKSSDMAISLTVTFMGIGSVIGNFLVGAIVDLFKKIFSGASGSLAMGLQAGYAFIGLCALLCSATALALYRFLKKKNQVL